MKKQINFLYVILVFAISTAAFFPILKYVNKGSNSGFEGVLEGVGYFFIWGIIFLYFFTRKLSSINKVEKNSNNSILFSFIVAIIVFIGVIVGSFLLMGAS